VSPDARDSLGAVGDLPCSEQGCANETGVRCTFIDRRGRKCSTFWCPEHRASAEGSVYCRRHAGVILALSASSATGSVPDLANRSPSLANWVANDIDDAVRVLLQGIARGGENLVVEPVALLYYGVERERRWERSWKLLDHTGVAIKVSIEVDEPTDPEVAVRVANVVVAKGVPPWIEHRRRSETIDPGLDDAERRQFYDFLLRYITPAVHLERERR
jgi:hypothetical protein